MGKGRPQKYNRISCQEKFKLRRLILKEKLSVKQAAQQLSINYSTAKTIMFFFRKTTSHSLSLSQDKDSSSNSLTASYAVCLPSQKIAIVNSIGGEPLKKNGFTHQDSLRQQVKVKDEYTF